MRSLGTQRASARTLLVARASGLLVVRTCVLKRERATVKGHQMMLPPIASGTILAPERLGQLVECALHQLFSQPLPRPAERTFAADPESPGIKPPKSAKQPFKNPSVADCGK